MGFLKTLGDAADKTALMIVNGIATSRASQDGVDCVPNMEPHPSKGQREPPPRVSKMTWKETLEAQKATKEKEADLHFKET